MWPARAVAHEQETVGNGGAEMGEIFGKSQFRMAVKIVVQSGQLLVKSTIRYPWGFKGANRGWLAFVSFNFHQTAMCRRPLCQT
jgi:hypothetical protein